MDFCRFYQHVHGKCKKDGQDASSDNSLFKLMAVGSCCSGRDSQVEVGIVVQDKVPELPHKLFYQLMGYRSVGICEVKP